jgi:hypothetical protein
MKGKLFVLSVVLMVLIAGRKAPEQPLYSHYTSWGYQDVQQGWMSFAALDWSVETENYYHIQNGVFVAPEMVLTKITGTCQQKGNNPFALAVTVDGMGYGYIVNTTDTSASFTFSEIGRVFDVQMRTDYPVQCNVLLEAVK